MELKNRAVGHAECRPCDEESDRAKRQAACKRRHDEGGSCDRVEIEQGPNAARPIGEGTTERASHSADQRAHGRICARLDGRQSKLGGEINDQRGGEPGEYAETHRVKRQNQCASFCFKRCP